VLGELVEAEGQGMQIGRLGLGWEDVREEEGKEECYLFQFVGLEMVR
jgi:hypothetical protein